LAAARESTAFASGDDLERSPHELQGILRQLAKPLEHPLIHIAGHEWVAHASDEFWVGRQSAHHVSRTFTPAAKTFATISNGRAAAMSLLV
jgi:hypothetical protein